MVSISIDSFSAYINPKFPVLFFLRAAITPTPWSDSPFNWFANRGPDVPVNNKKTHYHTVLVFHRGGRTCGKSFNNAITENEGEKYDQNQKAHLPTHFPTPLRHLQMKRKNPNLPIV